MKGFLKTMLHDHLVGAFAASSRYVIARVLAAFSPNTKIVIEYGPGDGVATHAVLRSLPADGTLFAIEHNHEFAESLKHAFQDSRVVIEEGDAVVWAAERGEKHPQEADAVISSIPLTFLSKEQRDSLFRNTHRVLRPGGVFVVFHQYSLLALPLLRKYFNHVEWHFEPRNVFPCFVMIARR